MSNHNPIRIVARTILLLSLLPTCLVAGALTPDEIKSEYGPLVMAVAQSYKTGRSKAGERLFGLKLWSNDEYRRLGMENMFKPGSDRIAGKMIDHRSGMMAVLHWTGADKKHIILSFAGADIPNIGQPFSWAKLLSGRFRRNLRTYGENSLSTMDQKGLKLAQTVLRTNPGKSVIIAGHSLGGRTAQYVGLTLSLPTVCFASLGLTKDHMKRLLAEKIFSSTNELKVAASGLIRHVVGGRDTFLKASRGSASVLFPTIASMGLTWLPAVATLNTLSGRYGRCIRDQDRFAALAAFIPALSVGKWVQSLLTDHRGVRVGKVALRLSSAGHLLGSLRNQILGEKKMVTDHNKDGL